MSGRGLEVSKFVGLKRKRKMKINIKLSKAYLENGFFNIPVKYKHIFSTNLKAISIKLKNEIFQCKIDFKANKTESPRVFGRRKLAEFFQKNFNLNDIVEIEFLEIENIGISSEEVEIKEFFRLHSHIIKKLEEFYCYLNVPTKNDRIIKIHIHSCGFCNYGTGRDLKGNEPGRNGAWLGPLFKN